MPPGTSIFQALKFIEVILDTFIGTGNPVVLGNIAFADPYQAGSDATQNIDDKVVLSLVNIEEEKTLRNFPYTTPRNGGYAYQNPPVFLNLYLLISVNTRNYETALIQLSRIIQFFQREHVFTPATHPELIDTNLEKLIFDLYSLSFEQMNHLWAVLGGKYIPSVLYKVRMLELQFAPEAPTPLIEEVENNSEVFFKSS